MIATLFIAAKVVTVDAAIPETTTYPLYLQKRLASQTVQCFCSDVVCRYQPYLQRVVSHCAELQELLNMRPFIIRHIHGCVR